MLPQGISRAPSFFVNCSRLCFWVYLSCSFQADHLCYQQEFAKNDSSRRLQLQSSDHHGTHLRYSSWNHVCRRQLCLHLTQPDRIHREVSMACLWGYRTNLVQLVRFWPCKVQAHVSICSRILKQHSSASNKEVNVTVVLVLGLSSTVFCDYIQSSILSTQRFFDFYFREVLLLLY